MFQINKYKAIKRAVFWSPGVIPPHATEAAFFLAPIGVRYKTWKSKNILRS
jgi:hypothetical protein